MQTKERTNVSYSYSYFTNENEMKFGLESTGIGKLPKIKMILPQISLNFCESLNFAIC